VNDERGQPAAVNDWVNVVRRARMHPTTKLVALLLASYANPDGTSIYPGIARVAVQSRQSYRTVQRELKHLRDMQLLESTKRQGTRRGWKAGYQLIFGPDVAELLDVPTPDEEAAAIEAVAEQNRARFRRHYAKRHLSGVSSDDQTPSADSDQTPRPNPLPAETKPLPSIRPLPVDKPSISRAQNVVPPERGRQPAAAALDGFDVSTRNGTAQALRAQADALTAWMLDHPESATS
jgi:hypothetical protein